MRTSERPTHYICIISNSVIIRDGRSSCHPNPWISLKWLWHRGGGWKIPIFPVMGIITLPQRKYCRQHFLHILISISLQQTWSHSVKLTLISSGAKTELQAATTNQIKECRLSSKLYRVPISCVHNGCSKANFTCLTSPPGKNLKRIGCNRHFQCMMFGSPNYVEAPILRHLYHLKRVTSHVIHSKAVVQTFKIYSELKFHVSFLFLSLLPPQHSSI